MTDGEKAILREIGNLRTSVENGLNRAHKRIDDANKQIDDTNKEVAEVKTIGLLNKTKLGTFTAGLSFAFTGIFALISHYLKSK